MSKTRAESLKEAISNNNNNNKHNDECLINIFKNNLKITFKPQINKYQYNEINNYLNPKNDGNEFTHYIVKITKKYDLPNNSNCIKRDRKKKKEFVRIIETPSLYKNYIKKYYNQLKINKPYYLKDLIDESNSFEKNWLNNNNDDVYWILDIDNNKFYLGPNCDNYFPCNMPGINDKESDIFPWSYVCIYINNNTNDQIDDNDIFSIRELNSAHKKLIDDLENKIKSQLSDRFGLVEERIIIKCPISISSSIGSLYFNITYVDEYSKNTKFKWEDDSEISIEYLKHLLEMNNNIDNMYFFYDVHISDTFFIPDKYFENIDEINKLSLYEILNDHIEKINTECEFEKIEVNKYLKKNSNYEDNIIKYEYNQHYKDGGSSILDKKTEKLVYKKRCKWVLINEEGEYEYSPKKLNTQFKFQYYHEHKKIIGNFNLVHLFGNYFVYEQKKKYDKQKISEYDYDVYQKKKLDQNYSIKYDNNLVKGIIDDKNDFIKKIRDIGYDDYSYYKTDKINENSSFGNFLIIINNNDFKNFQSLEENFLFLEDKSLFKNKDKKDIKYYDLLNDSKHIPFIGWYNCTENDHKIQNLQVIKNLIDNGEETNENFKNWLIDQKKQIIEYMEEIFNNNNIFIMFSFHYPNIKEFQILHIRIDVYINNFAYYNRRIDNSYIFRNIYVDDIITQLLSNDSFFLPDRVLLRMPDRYYLKEDNNLKKDNLKGGSKNNIDSWLKDFNSEIIFYGIVNKNFRYKFNFNKKKKIEDIYLKFLDLKKNEKKINEFEKKLDIRNYFNKKSNTSRLEYYLNNFYNKFDINIEIHKILIINSEKNINYNFNHQNLTVINNLNDLNNLNNLNNKFDFVHLSYKNTSLKKDMHYQSYHLKVYLKIFLKILNLIKKNGIVSMNLGLIYEPSSLDFLLLLNDYSSLFILSDFYRTDITAFPIRYIFSEFWKINDLKYKIKKIIDNFDFKHGNSFLEIVQIDKNIITKIKYASNFMINRYIKINEIVNNQIINDNDINNVKEYLFQNKINYKIKLNPENIPIITRMLSSKLFYLPNGDALKLHSNINMNEGNYLYNIVTNNNMTQLLEVGFAYGVSAMFMTKALEFNKSKKKNNYQLTSIDPFQRKQWHNLGLHNLKRINTETFHKLYEDKSLNILPYLLKEKNKQYDLIFIDGWHTFDYALVDLFYSTFLIKKNGYLILDDALHPGVSKLIKYIDTNYMGFLQKITNGPKTFGIYVKKGEDDRKWDYHKDF